MQKSITDFHWKKLSIKLKQHNNGETNTGTA